MSNLKSRDRFLSEISKALALSPILKEIGINLFLNSMGTNDRIEQEKRKLIERIGETKAFDIFDQIKTESYNQTENNSVYILSKLLELNYTH